MCLLTFMPKGLTISYEHARRAATSNPDGFGFAIHAGDTILTDHDMDFERLWTRFLDARKVQQGAAMFHFRIATHGTVNTDNCHPFYVGDDTQSVLGHNGMLPIAVPVGENRSDTRLFAEIVLPHCGGVERLDDDKFFKELEAWSSGSKLVIMTTNPATKYDYYIVNEQDGHWGQDGVWYSNSSYKQLVYTGYSRYTYGSMYDSGGWSAKTESISKDDIGAWGWDSYDYGYDDDDNARHSDEAELENYLLDELYADTEWTKQVLTFTTLNGWDYALVECFNCGAITPVDPVEPSHTHCGHCKACLVCTETGLCKCWDGYEYHQSFTPTSLTEVSDDKVKS